MLEIETSQPEKTETGMELCDLLAAPEFQSRAPKPRDYQQPFDALRRVMQVFADEPEMLLQELVNIAMTCCGADGAGISLLEQDEAGELVFRWVALAGSFSQYLNACLPRFFSPCGTCLDKGMAQLFRVTKPYYDYLGVAAEPITDGMLIPWEAEGIRGTIWVVAHHSRAAFDLQDYQLVKSLADFVAISRRQQMLAEKAHQTAKAEASLARAHKMAHQINNPLQSLTNTLFLARCGGPQAQVQLETATEELAALSDRVRRLLALKYGDE